MSDEDTLRWQEALEESQQTNAEIMRSVRFEQKKRHSPHRQMPKTESKREHLVPSAAYWFGAARTAQNKGYMADALMCMENAYNHVENALAAAIEALEKCDPVHMWDCARQHFTGTAPLRDVLTDERDKLIGIREKVLKQLLVDRPSLTTEVVSSDKVATDVQ